MRGDADVLHRGAELVPDLRVDRLCKAFADEHAEL
jgi:hypothetical protein